MKRALVLAIIIAAVVAGFLSVRGVMPFMAVYGGSMEPEFKAGDLITISDVSPSEIEVGDVIIFTVPPMVREAYDYPKVVVHRVVRAVTTERGTTFRTRGDNVGGEDPFMVRSQDIKGVPGRQIPYLGFPLLFLQSQQGLIFVIVGLCLLAMYLYVDELSRGRSKLQVGLFAPVIDENRRSSRLLEQRIETTEKGMASTELALNRFASAVEVYAEHLNSHTSAIQGLSEASQELKRGAAEQNQVLARLLEVTEKAAPRQEEKASSHTESVISEAEETGQEKAAIAQQQAQPIAEESRQEKAAVAQQQAQSTAEESREGRVAVAQQRAQAAAEERRRERLEVAQHQVQRAVEERRQERLAIAQQQAQTTAEESRQEKVAVAQQQEQTTAEESRQEKVAVAQQQAQPIAEAAEDETEQITVPAEEEATRIISEARQEAGELARMIMANAKGLGQIRGDIPTGDLFNITPNGDYTGDLAVKVCLTNTDDLVKAYRYLNIKLYLRGSVEAGKMPNYLLLTLDNGEVTLNLKGYDSGIYALSVTGGSYCLVSRNTADWEEGWTITPKFYCQILQR